VTYQIEISNLSKRYEIGALQQPDQLREALVGFLKQPFRAHRKERESIWALSDVSFKAEPGEVLGIVGRNGAGKSTLLKILSRITYPSSGRIRVRGRVSSLLEVGTGFHEELTGRENVYMNGSILGMKKREIDRHFDAIVDFAGVEKFLDTPMKRYSSGMRLRLGFAVAAHLDPDVLIVDEVLAVGDAGFQKKCIKTMEGLQKSGRTVLFVSHNLAAVENLCSRGIWLDGGKVRMDGGTREVILAYMSSFAGADSAGSDLSQQASRLGSGEIQFTRVEYLAPDGTSCGVTRSGDPLVIRMHYKARRTMAYPSFGLRLYSEMGTLITETSHFLHGLRIPVVESGEGFIDLEIDLLNLVPGSYHLSLWVTAAGGLPVYDGDVRAELTVEVAGVYPGGRELNKSLGIVYFPQRWRIPQLESVA